MSLDDPVALRRARVAELHRFERGRTALLVIDMQRGFLEEGAALEVPEARAIVPVVRDLVDVARGIGIPVIFTKFIATPEVPTLRVDPFGPEHLPPVPGEPTGLGHPSGNCMPGQDGPDSPEIVLDLQPGGGELIVEGRLYDKFHGTCLDQALRARDIRSLVVTGILAEVCVHATVLGAASREYRVTIIRDGVAALRPDLLAAFLEVWERKLARLVTADEAAVEFRGLAAPAGRRRR
jgi:nicotinamidase-related amidase